MMKILTSSERKLDSALYRNAFILMLTSGLGGLFSFVFWLIVATYYSSDAVGFSASLLALVGFLGSLSSLGLGVGLIRFLPSTVRGRNHRINTSLTLAAITASALGLVFLGSIDVWSPAIAFVRGNFPLAIMFVAFTVGFALSPLVDSSFLAARKASYVLHRSLIYNGLRLPILIIVVTSLGTFGILFSFGVALLVALLVSFFFLIPRLYPGFTVAPSLQLSRMRDMLAYSVGNHAANLLLALPTGVLPLLVLNELSAASSAHFYIAWIMANFLYLVAVSSARSLFIEASHPGTFFAEDAVRSLRFSLLLLIPGILLLFFAGPFLLGLFGGEYSTGGLSLLRILALSALFVAINSTFFSLLRVNKRIRELTLLSLVLGVGTVVGSYLLLDGFGLLGPGMAFFSIQAAISSYVLLRNWGVSKRVVKGLIRP